MKLIATIAVSAAFMLGGAATAHAGMLCVNTTCDDVAYNDEAAGHVGSVLTTPCYATPETTVAGVTACRRSGGEYDPQTVDVVDGSGVKVSHTSYTYSGPYCGPQYGFTDVRAGSTRVTLKGSGSTC